MAKKRNKARAEPQKKRSASTWLCSVDAYDALICNGYTSLENNPEIIAGVDTIAKLVGSMTIHLMENTDKGDIRLKNELSRKVDISPNENMTRSSFIQWIVKTLYLKGNGNAIVFPKTKRGYLEDLKPVPAYMVNLIPEGMWDYSVNVNGANYKPNQILHFTLSPDEDYPWKGKGLRVPLKEVADNLKQAAATEKGFMQTKWKPSVIVKVDSGSEEFASPQGRRKILENYVETTEAGEPWVLPSEEFDVEVVKPLTLSDLAIADVVELDKRTVASILRIPAFVLGVGEFKKEEWNNFINSTIMPLTKMIEQELTRKLLYAPKLYFKFNPRSLYNYSLTEIVSAGGEMVDRMAMRRNEWRDWAGLPPDSEMEELLALENYIPANRLGDQNKLTGGE